MASTSITDSGLTSGRVTYASTGGLLADSAALTWDGTTLAATKFSGALNGTVGATTPSTGAFTTLSSTGDATLCKTNGNITAGYATSGGTLKLDIYDSSLTSTTIGSNRVARIGSNVNGGDCTLQFTDSVTYNSYISAKANHLYIQPATAGTYVADFSSTGLAVTGVLTSTLDATIYGVTVGRGGGAVSTNTAVGASALSGAVTGGNNVAIGYQALRVNTSGSGGTSVGTNSLLANTTGTDNSAFGIAALAANTTGSNNTALGREALQANTTAIGNTAVGYQAGYNSVTNRNTYVGHQAGYGGGALHTTEANTAIGHSAGYGLTTGSNNTFVGGRSDSGTNSGAGFATSTGSYNNFFGGSAGANVTSGSKNTIIGNYEGAAAPISATGSNYVVLSDGDGNIVASSKTAQTFALQGGTLSTGTGIAFPATQSASSDANTLDDYEEGTFTPTAYGSSSAGTTTYTVQQGSYTKIGNQVTVSVRISWSALTGTGELTFGGFPFASANNSMEYMGATMTDSLNWGGGTYLQFYKNANTTTGVLFYMADDAAWNVQQCVNESAGIRFTVTYFV